MKYLRPFYLLVFTATIAYSQTGHIMQGVGAVNMSMGGAATAQPLDISGAMHWNPGAISTFDKKLIKLDIGLFFSSPEVTSSLPAGMLGPGAPAVKGTTEDDRSASPMPSLAMVWGKPDSKHTFGASIFGISGFGVTFPEEVNNPLSASFNPTLNSNPINYPQAAGGFGRIESDYMLLQVGFTWSYQLNKNLSIGLQPTFNWASLELIPNPTANPNQAGYPSSDKASATGFGGQIGLFYQSESGLKAGLAYKSTQYFSDFEFTNSYLDASSSKSTLAMDYPAIYSAGLGYSVGKVDLAVDYRYVDYENTDGFSETGWNPTASVKGFGWKNISIVSAGLQYKGLERVPLRVGYTYSTNPIPKEVTFFNVPATAIIKNAFQFGASYLASDKLTLDAVYHYGTSAGATKGQLLNPAMITPSSPYGAIPGSEVSYEMTTSMIMIGVGYTINQ